MEIMSRDHMEELAMKYASRWASPSNAGPDYKEDVAKFLMHYDRYLKEIQQQIYTYPNPQ